MLTKPHPSEEVLGREMKIRADMIKRALAKRHDKDFFVTECKSGPTHTAARGELGIFDAIAVKKSWTQPCVTIYEVKVNRNDFLSDIKWPAYKKYCHRLYFACPKGLIAPDEVSNGVGLIYYNPENQALHTAKKAVYQDNPLPTDVFYYILMNKIESDRHPFFSKKREYIERALEDKEERYELNQRFKSYMTNKLGNLEKESEHLRRQVESYKKFSAEIENIRAILKSNGITLGWNSHNLDAEIKRLRGVTLIPGEIEGALKVISREVELIQKFYVMDGTPQAPADTGREGER